MRSWLLSSGLSALLVFGCCGQKNTPGDTKGSAQQSDSTARREAPKHNAPDQDRIDSLKQEKEKTKH
jgi:hypothetical protein